MWIFSEKIFRLRRKYQLFEILKEKTTWKTLIRSTDLSTGISGILVNKEREYQKDYSGSIEQQVLLYCFPRI